MLRYLFLLGLLGTALSVGAQAGNPDSTFGTNGKVLAPFILGNSGGESGRQLFMQKDGSLLLLWSAGPGLMLSQFSGTGKLNQNYGNNGVVQIKPVADPGAALQQDGKLVVGGSRSPQTFVEYIVLHRYHNNGRIDSSFGNNGEVQINLTTHDQFSQLRILPDGKILVAGRLPDKNQDDFWEKDVLLMRLHPDGDVDSSFGTNGINILNLPDQDISVNDMLLLPDGNIIIAGNLSSPSGWDAYMARYNDNGFLDNNFGSNGILTIDLLNTTNVAGSLALDPQGRLLLAGSIMNDATGNLNLALLRMLPSGAPDLSFGEKGLIIRPEDQHFYVNDLLLLANGGIVVSGGPEYGPLLYGFHADGSVNTSFGDNGRVAGSPGASMIRLDDGGFLATGAINYDYAIVQYKPNGTRNPVFGSNGLVSGFYPVGSSSFNTLLVQADKKIIGGGSFGARYSTSSSAAMARFNTNGTPDTSFGNNGAVLTDFAPISQGTIGALQEQNDGKIIAGGAPLAAGLARYLPDGTPDSTFDKDGKVSSDMPTWGGSFVKLPDGSYLMAVIFYENGTAGFIRFTANGSRDLSLGTKGVQMVALGNKAFITDMELHPNGRSIITGYAELNNLRYGFIARILPDGRIDSSFATNGIYKTTFFSKESSLSDLVMLPNGMIVAAGAATDAVQNQTGMLVVRLTQDGKPDTAFGKGGIILLKKPGIDVFGSVVAVQPDNKLLIAGQQLLTPFAPRRVQLILTRLLPDGSLDHTFGSYGQTNDSFNGKLLDITRMAVSDNRVYIAGAVTDELSDYGMIAAYRTDGCNINRYYQDKDKDRYGNAAVSVLSCDLPKGYVADSSDCNDELATVNPDEPEAQDGIDNNCNGTIDEPYAVVDRVEMINPSTNYIVKTLEDGDTINIAAVAGRAVNIWVMTNPYRVGSLKLELSGQQQHIQVENIAPFTLFGNKEFSFKRWRPEPGNYTLKATPYSSPQGKGVAGRSNTLSFTIEDRVTLSGFTLINTRNNQETGPLQEGTVIDLATTPAFTIRVKEGVGIAGSVLFGINSNTNYRLENKAPFAIATNTPDRYWPWSVQPGTYTITATPYSLKGKKGTAGPPISITIKVIDSRVIMPAITGTHIQPTLGVSTSLTVAPNPAISFTNIYWRVEKTTYLKIELLDANGKYIHSIFSGKMEAGAYNNKHLGTSHLSKGVYFCRMSTAEGIMMTRKLLVQ